MAEKEKSEVQAVKSFTDLQRLKIEKLMKNPEKPVFIPESRKDKKFPDAPEFVRNVMGSSAGAGSGEFHVYRHIRRREYARAEYLNKCSEKDELDKEHFRKMQENKEKEEDKTSKKRAKRQRAKQRLKDRKRNKGVTKSSSESEGSEDEENEELNKEGNEEQNKGDKETNDNNSEKGKKSLQDLLDKANTPNINS